jgi:hypothetical protein
MAHTSEIQTNETQAAKSIGMKDCERNPVGTRFAGRRVSIEQEQADFAAWLREYRRWTQSGSCAPARGGEIEWGGEGGSGH